MNEAITPPPDTCNPNYNMGKQLEYARWIDAHDGDFSTTMTGLARALLSKEAELRQVAKERDEAVRAEDGLDLHSRTVGPDRPLANGLYLSIQDTVYRVEICEKGYTKDIRRIVKLTKLAGEGEEYHAVQFTDERVRCECASWEFRHSKEPDHRTEASMCKHLRALAAPGIGLIQLPPVEERP